MILAASPSARQPKQLFRNCPLSKVSLDGLIDSRAKELALEGLESVLAAAVIGFTTPLPGTDRRPYCRFIEEEVATHELSP